MTGSSKAAQGCNKFYGIEDYLDIVLEVDSGDREKPVRFACHKVELAKASKRFQDMMRKQELEVDANGVDVLYVADVDAKTLEKMLRHIYNHNIGEKELMNAKLLDAAHHYNIESLMRICVAATIPKTFTIENILGALKIAYQLDLPNEKKATFRFLWENFEALAGTKEFQQLLASSPGLVADFMVQSKGFTTCVQNGAGFEMEKKLLPFTSNGPNDDEGDPVLVGTITSKAGIQEFKLPDTLPSEAKGVRILAVQVLQAGMAGVPNAFVKMWSTCDGGKCIHFICRNRLTQQMDYCQAPELFFPIDETNRKIFADASKVVYQNAGYEEYYTISVYLVGYVV